MRAVRLLRTKSPAARVAGARAQASGRRGEHLVEAALAFYREHGTAEIQFCPPRTAGRQGKLRIIRKGGVDYTGAVRIPNGPGVPVAFDVKRTAEASFAVRPKDRHQIAALLRFRAAGALAGYLVILSEHNACVWLDGVFLDELAAGARVVLTRRGAIVQPPSRCMPFTPEADVAAQKRPRLDPLPLWLLAWGRQPETAP